MIEISIHALQQVGLEQEPVLELVLVQVLELVLVQVLVLELVLVLVQVQVLEQVPEQAPVWRKRQR